MKNINIKIGTLVLLFSLIVGGCKDLDEVNENPNGVSPSNANVNMLMPTILVGVGQNLVNLGYQDLAGVVQHTQKDGWNGGHNHYEWGLQDWTGWYGLLRTNEFMIRRAEETNSPFHKAVGLTMKSLIFGMVTDLWGDAPYTKALQGDKPGKEYQLPEFDSQEVIYRGIIADLKAASALFATSTNATVIPQYDVYFGGNVARWQKFANSLLLRYYLRVSDKLPDLAKAGIEEVAKTGIYLTDASEDVVMDYIGASAADSWPTATSFDAGSNFRRLKPCNTLLDYMLETQDPRTKVWFREVHCQWVEDKTLTTAVDPFIRRNGVLQQGVVSLTDEQYLVQIAAGNKFTRHYNPDILGSKLDTRSIVGLPPGALSPSEYNRNPTPGQTLENQHASQLADIYRQTKHALLKARIISAAEVYFILAEASLKGYAVGNAESHYRNGVQSSLKTWGVLNGFDAYIKQPKVAYNGTVKQIIEQKWIASWTNASEAWFDYRRTGFPVLKVGPASPEPVLPVRFIYGGNEINFNNERVTEAINRLEVTPYEGGRGPNNQWSKTWINQGTNKPW
ncbi:SusD/RagB family nutrient-binding outer membrane lipoprotein [Algoriphagus sp. AK58]|uniref:SusD/RagB family nutrient-binding outer membrane lipoprotein n=1 Tax=Algoriphagus sp. AK58 TaxID=1406877 RepID=UPI00165074E3|nr:SusD/RagB family nutrient-binding outer membrane lipoprotein [Algoriphagus sp. AK58]MBC6366849.1 SusD/RagB family nutrient-binding outer membrane lipoprotein [Algoriphagus sp. AK58]